MSAPRNVCMVIMAGGSGERFWPVSNRKTPKQLLRLKGNQSLLAMAFNRARLFVEADRIFIVAGEHLRKPIHRNLPDLPSANFIAEPLARNTAACLGLAACHIERLHTSDAVMGVLTADHVIDEGVVFQSTITAALIHAAQSSDLIAIGIRPTRPETGFGYLEMGDALAQIRVNDEEKIIRRINRFREKPDAETAQKFFASGVHLWNSGMFFWKLGALFEAFNRHQPEMADAWRRIRDAAESRMDRIIAETFPEIPSIPIDVAIMEKSPNIAAIEGKFSWEDVGSWDAIDRIHPADSAGNRLVGPAIALDSRNTIVYNDVGKGKGAAQEVILLGLDDLVIARTDKAILVAKKSDAQRVREIVRHLKETDREDLL